MARGRRRYRIAFRDRLMDVATEKSAVPAGMDGFQELRVKCPPLETVVTP